MFSDKSVKVLYNITFVVRCAFYTAVFVLLLGISQELIAIRFTLDNIDRKIPRPPPVAVDSEASQPPAKKSQ